MNFKHAVKKTVFIPAATAVAVLAAVLWPAASVSASSGDAVAGTPLPSVTLSQNTSYVSNEYFGVLHVDVGDSAVACASADSQNRLVVTAVGTGSTAVTFWYKNSATDSWTSTSMPVTVTDRTSSQTVSVVAGSYGISFLQPSVAVSSGASYTPQNIRLNGYSVDASTLLWVSSNDSIATVDKSTGTVTCVGKGTVSIYAVDPSTKYCGSYTVTVS